MPAEWYCWGVVIPGKLELPKWVRLPVINGDGRGKIREFEMGKLDAGGDIVADGLWNQKLFALRAARLA